MLEHKNERLIEKLNRLGAKAGIETMTPEIRRFALLVRADVVAEWPSRPWVGLTEAEFKQIMLDTYNIDLNAPGHASDDHLLWNAIEAKLKEKNK